ncbi:PAS domain S-box protein [Candidatus Sumerlaeota bacterium]|nr:PAS domain S-box protein [Candidatus Sumerlaeota bacterium]
MSPAESNSVFRQELERLLLEISTEFISLPLESIDQGMIEALEKLGTLAQAQCCQILVRNADQEAYLPRVSWRRDSSEPAHHVVARLDAKTNAPLFATLAADGFLSSRSKEVALLDEALKQLFLKQIERGSCLTMVPLDARHQPAGLLVIQAKEQSAERLQGNMPLVQVLAQIIGNLLDRKQAHDELATNREHLDAIISSLDVMIWSGAPAENRLLFMSPAGEKIYGRPIRQFRDDPELWRKVVHPDDAHLVADYEEQLRVNGVARREYRILRGDGTIRWVNDSATVARDENGKATRINGILSDITERKRAEHALMESQQHLQSIVQGVSIILFAIDTNGIFTLADGRGLRSMAMRARDVVGKSIQDVFHNSDAMLVGWKKALSGAAFMQVILHGGSFFEMRFSPVKKIDGTVEGAVAVGTDVSARETAQIALQESEDRFRRLASATSEGVGILRDGVFTDVNEMLCSMFGYSRTDLIGKKTLSLIAPTSHESFHDSKDRDKSSFELVGLRSNGSTFPIELSERIAAEESIHSRVVVIRDITIQTRALEEYRRARDVAEQAAHLKSEFLANMSHEIRTPLHVVLSMAELLAHSALNADQREYLQKIDASGRALLELINDILDFSKIEAGKLELETVSFLLSDLFDEIIELQEDRAHSKGLEFSTSIDPQVPRYLYGDPARLRQVMLNLTSNAIKFTQHGAVRVMASLQEVAERGRVSIRFSVVDTGVGIPAHLHEKLFKSFSQVDASTTRRYGGTGLGLVISRAIVSAMGGSIEVHSRENEGSEFSFTVSLRIGTPIAPSAEMGITPTDPAPFGQHQGPDKEEKARRILVVEDNPVNQFVAKGMLKILGYDIDIANNGKEALEILQARSYDLIFMDCQMPILDGYATTRAIRHLESGKRSVPIVAMTANAMKGDAEKCLEAGMDAYVSKPVSLETLRNVLNTHLRATSAARDGTSRKRNTPLPVNQDRIRSIFGTDAEASRKFVELFLSEFDRRHQAMRAHLESGNFAKLDNIAHALKGSTGNVGAEHLMNLMSEMGIAARALDNQRCRQTMDLIDAEAARVFAFLRSTHAIGPQAPNPIKSN